MARTRSAGERCRFPVIEVERTLRPRSQTPDLQAPMCYPLTIGHNTAHDLGKCVIQTMPELHGLSRNRSNQPAISKFVVGKQKACRQDKHQPSKGHGARCVNLTPMKRLSIQTTSQCFWTLPSLKRLNVK